MKTTPTLITLALLITAAFAVPTMAQPPDHAGGQGGGPGHDDNRTGDDNRTRGQDDNRSRGPDDNRSRGPDDNRSRGPPAHVLERMEARCEAAENRSGHRPAACDRLSDIHNASSQARRAAHAGLQAVSAWEHLNATLARLEEKFQDKLAQENLTANQTAAYEAKLERIDAMQANLTAKIAAMEEKIAGMQERWQEVREHVEERRAQRGGDDEAEAESEAESEEEESEEEESEEESDEDAADDSSEGNETADP